MVVVSDCAIVGDGGVEGAVLTAADAAHDRIVMTCLLSSRQALHSAVYFEMFNDISLAPDVLVEELVYGVFAREQIKLFVEGRHY